MMRRLKLFWLLFLIALLCVSFAGCELPGSADTTNGDSNAPTMNFVQEFISVEVGTPSDEVADNACYLYAPQMVEDTFRYLDEIYIDRYPEMGLRWDRGVTADMRIFTAFAQQLTAGCSTDAEKVSAIYDWIVNNIEYKLNSSPMSVDVLYNGHGNCLGQALLLQDLCRMVGIPAVFGDGFRGHMKSFTVEAMHSMFDGHAWCYVYVDGQWHLYDPVWSLKGTTDRQFIAEHYFTDMVGGITPIYDENNMPPFRDPETVFAYMNGKYTLLKDGKISDAGGAGFWLNMAYNLSVERYAENSGMHYLDAPAYVYEGLEENELFSNGWVAYGEPFAFTGIVHYFYENGLMASEIVINRNGTDYYMDQGIAYKLCMPQDVYTMRYGQIKIQTGYKGKIWEPSEEMLQGGTYELSWSTDDPTVATIDQNGVVTNLKPGMVDIQCHISYKSTLPGVDLVVEEDLDWTVYFWDESPRPEKFAALDPGGPAGITIRSESLGPRGITPIITVPEIWGDETPPSDGIEFGYPMIPSEELSVEFINGNIFTEISPENGIFTLPAMPEYNGVDLFLPGLQPVKDQNCGLKFTLSTGEVILDASTVQLLMSGPDAEAASIWLVKLKNEWCDYGQQERLAQLAVDGIYHLHGERSVENGEINDLGGGVVTVTVPLNGTGSYGVYFVDARGNLTAIPSQTENGTITFSAPYFATYAVIDTAQTPID